jgi:phosphoribosylformimino-5-aminoimidazole carboxamide ribotide isomerase
VLLIPAIDLKDGHCAPASGRMDDETVFSDDPVDMAGRWVGEGARRLHLVDLNGAFAGEPVNGEAVRAIAARFPGLPIQVGGGIRDEQTIAAYLDAGVTWCIIGTQAVKEPALVGRACRAFPGHVIVLTGRQDGQVAIKGWRRSEHRVERQAPSRVAAIVYTDIGRDGMLSGPNLEATRHLADAISTPVIASGGITNLADVRALAEASRAVAGSGGIVGAITGRAIYEGTLDFAAGQRLADGLLQ